MRLVGIIPGAGRYSVPMRVYVLLLASLISCAFNLHAQEQALCDTHDWFSTSPREANGATSLLCKGVLDSSFERRKEARAELLQVVANAPQSPQAYRAHDVLTSMYFRAGQYREALKELDERLRLRPNDKDLLNDRLMISALSKEPDQTGRAKHAKLPKTVINAEIPISPYE